MLKLKEVFVWRKNVVDVTSIVICALVAVALVIFVESTIAIICVLVAVVIIRALFADQCGDIQCVGTQCGDSQCRDNQCREIRCGDSQCGNHNGIICIIIEQHRMGLRNLPGASIFSLQGLG